MLPFIQMGALVLRLVLIGLPITGGRYAAGRTIETA